MKPLCVFALVLVFLLPNLHLIAQPETGIHLIEIYLDDNLPQKAESELNSQIDQFKKQGNLDTLASYPYLTGKVYLKSKTQKIAAAKSEKLLEELKTLGASDRTMYKAYMDAITFFDEAGLAQRSYELTAEALLHAEKMPDKTHQEIGFVEYNLGASALSLGNFKVAKKHFRKALSEYKSHPGLPPTKLSDAYNAMGAMMWLSTKLDSAKHFYSLAVDALENMDDDPVNKSYLSAIVQANIGLIHFSQGESSDAIAFTRRSIDNYEFVLDSSKDDNQLHKARRYQLGSLSNLATIYNDLGDYRNSNRLMEFVLIKQREFLQSDHPDIFKTQIKIAQSTMTLQEYPKAKIMLEEALEAIKRTPGELPYWVAVSHYNLAKTCDEMGLKAEALSHYDMAETAFEKAQKEEYDRDYLNFLKAKSAFLAGIGQKEKAITSAEKGYRYTLKTGGENFLLVFSQAVNLAQVNYSLKNFEVAKKWSDLALAKLESSGTTNRSLEDSLLIEFHKPQAILLQVQSEYQGEKERDQPFLEKLATRLDEALALIARSKVFNHSPENFNLFLEENNEVFDFAKVLQQELYEKTNNPVYLNRLLSLHESGLYNRIRARLQLRKGNAYAGVPKEIIGRESEIRMRIEEALEGANGGDMDVFFKASSDWDSYMADLKKSYPKYYKMRFGSILQPVDNILKDIPEGTTVLRYQFVGDDLSVAVLNNTGRTLRRLNFSPVIGHISELNKGQSDLKKTSKLLRELYDVLWAPIADQIVSERIIIIPDRDLFNLSFETLLFKDISGFQEFAENSLIAKHMISYHFSLFLLEKEELSTDMQSNYTAFAPGFFDQMKENYRSVLKDSLNSDQAFLNLLPQPFTSELVLKMKKLFGGNVFYGHNATESAFKSLSTATQILHLGTHAESNNLSPELSNLAFAKEKKDEPGEDDGYLYAYEIYNCDLKSYLTLLTACETGKPSYQPGEGMISLAHAFNYAGSQSILTGLWKIDEPASAKITELFLLKLVSGQAKDAALREAKLEYLNSAKGRTLSPEYWGGLVLVGDSNPVNISQKSTSWLWGLLLGGILITGLGLRYWRREK